MDGINQRLDLAEEKISEFEDMPVETTQNEAQREVRKNWGGGKPHQRNSIKQTSWTNGLTYM